jgi:RimJ/RimL family protein N-acetyltransferase
MVLETPRLILRPWKAEDRAPFFAINGEPAVLRFLPAITRAESDAMLGRIDAHIAENGWGFWAIEERLSGTLIGMCGLAHVRWQAFFTPAVEIGWRLGTAWMGKGFAREAAERALRHGFEDI